MDWFIVTNNVEVKNEYGTGGKVIYLEDKMYIDVLHYVRDKVHMGHRLLTHVLSGSVKPNETPYKSVLVSREQCEMDLDSLSIIESSIQVYMKFEHTKNNPKWTQNHLKDFRTIDLSLIKSAIVNSQLL